MTAIVANAKGRWGAALVGAAVVTALLLLLFRIPPVQELAVATPPANVRPVELAPAAAKNSALGEAALMRDLTPLFLPTRFNAHPPPRVGREPGGAFRDEEPVKTGFGEAELTFGGALPPVVTLEGAPLAKATAADALAENSPTVMMLGFGRRAPTLRALPARGGIVAVVSTATGKHVLPTQMLAPEAAPATDKPWQPLGFLASVDAAGLVAPLIFTRRSGVEEVDQHFKNYLEQTYRIGERLPPGFYRITVGP